MKRKVSKRAVGAIQGMCAWPLAQDDEACLQKILPENPEEGCWQTTRKDHPEMVLSHTARVHTQK